MITKGRIKTGKYFDSVSLMNVAKEVTAMEGVIDAAAVMGTEENRSILRSSNMLLDEFLSTDATDLLLCVSAENEKIAEEALEYTEELLVKSKEKSSSDNNFIPKSIKGALKTAPEANMAVISIAGQYAGDEADKALDNGLNVMLFSDNVSLEQEVELKKKAKEKGLIVMGPDCGTAIINGVPLAFANVVGRGNIGLVAASGTGLQEVTCLIANLGGGISQAVGTGGRDVSSEVGGISFLTALKMLKEDDETDVVVLVSKPPAEDVLKKISEEVKNLGKTVVAVFLGGSKEIVESSGALYAATLEEAAHMAVAAAKGENPKKAVTALYAERDFEKTAEWEASSKTPEQKYLRGLFCGGTFAKEAQYILSPVIGDIYGNVALRKELALEDVWKSKEHTVIDLGEDEFTVGRPHPMIDFSLRTKKIIEEAGDEEVAVILLDMVLGYGSNMTPVEETAPVIKEAIEIAKKAGRTLSVVFSVTGTDKDPQKRASVIKELQEAGAVYAPSNAAASKLSAEIINKLKG